MCGWRDDPRVKGVLLIGSTASGTQDPLSDLDFVVVAEPIPDSRARARAYRRAGCTKAIIGFYRSNAPILASNVPVVDKAWIGPLQLDISYCGERGVGVYRDQDFVVLKGAKSGTHLRRIGLRRESSPSRSTDRLSYAYRILAVHRDRYVRWSKRKRWLCVDLSTFLCAARDMILVLDGQPHYHPADPRTWTLVEAATAAVPGLANALEEIKTLDDRMDSRLKLDAMDRLIEALEQWCVAEGVHLRLYDFDTDESAGAGG